MLRSSPREAQSVAPSSEKLSRSISKPMKYNFASKSSSYMCFLVANADPLVDVWQLSEYVAFAISVTGVRYYRRWPSAGCQAFLLLSSVRLDTQHPRVRNAMKRMALGYAKVGLPQRERLAVSWAVLKVLGVTLGVQRSSFISVHRRPVFLPLSSMCSVCSSRKRAKEGVLWIWFTLYQTLILFRFSSFDTPRFGWGAAVVSSLPSRQKDHRPLVKV